MKKSRTVIVKRALALLAVAVALVGGVLAWRAGLYERLSPAELVTFLRSQASHGWAVPLYLLLFGVASALLAPAMGLVAVACVTWGFWPGVLVAWLAENVWANVHFFIGRLLGRRHLSALLVRFKLGRVVRELERGGVLATVVVRQLPLPFIGVNLAAGATPIRWSRWLVGNALGLLPGAIVIGQLAAGLADGLAGAKEEAARRLVVGAVLVVALTVTTRLLLARREARLRDSSGDAS